LKYFVCAQDKISIAIPAEQTEHIISVTRVQKTVCETENQEIFISLPVLLRQEDSTAPHGIILKSKEPSAVKTVLLTPRIDMELEIPEEKIHSLPAAMGGVYTYFRGAYCAEQNVILVLNTEKIKEVAGRD